MKISEIFKDEPAQWGFRGDPYLWRDMAARLNEIEMPNEAQELKIILEHTFTEATGHPLSHSKPFVIESFKHGGMSSGGVSPEFWLKRGIPLLVSRHVKP